MVLRGEDSPAAENKTSCIIIGEGPPTPPREVFDRIPLHGSNLTDESAVVNAVLFQTEYVIDN